MALRVLIVLRYHIVYLNFIHLHNNHMIYVVLLKEELSVISRQTRVRCNCRCDRFGKTPFWLVSPTVVICPKVYNHSVCVCVQDISCLTYIHIEVFLQR